VTAFSIDLDEKGRPGGGDVAGLVRAAAAGHQASWDRLVGRFSGLLWAVARAHRLGQADAADVVQITWLRLVEHLARLKDPGRVGAWLATTARRECLRVLRDAQRCVPHSDELCDPCGDETPTDHDLLIAERDRALRDSLLRLRPSDQALLRLLMADPRPAYDEIAATLNMPVGSIGPTRARALERLRRELDGAGSLALLSVG
jgi:RNA polymerase sigma factor (sigma-70 family)